MGEKQLGIFGATGVVGDQIVSALVAADFDMERLKVFASPESDGEEFPLGEDVLTIKSVSDEEIEKLSSAILAVPPEVAKPLALRLESLGVSVIDLSGAFGAAKDVALVAEGAMSTPSAGRIVALAHPWTQLLLWLREVWKAPLGDCEVQIIHGASLYGRRGLAALSQQTAQLLNAQEVEVQVFPHRLAFNLLAATGPEGDPARYLERRVATECGRFQLGTPEFAVSVVCAPIFHGALASVSFSGNGDAEALRLLLREVPRFKLLDSPEEKIVPMPMLSVEDPDFLVGKVRVKNGRVSIVATADAPAHIGAAAVRVALALEKR